MIRVHHLNNSRSQRLLWLLEELELPYDLTTYQRNATMLAPEALRKIHPLGKAPILEDDGKIIAETGAIFEYIIDRYGARLAPPAGSDLRQQLTYWLHYAEGSIMPLMLLKLIINKLGLLGWPVRGLTNGQIALHLDYLESQLPPNGWFVSNEFSAADIMMSFPLEVAASRAGLDASWPNLWSFLLRIHIRPAYRQALLRGGDYAFAKP